MLHFKLETAHTITLSMGASLSYRAEPTPSKHIVDLIVKEAAALSRISNYWCEPFCFLASADQTLHGLTKVSLAGYSAPDGTYVAVDPTDDMVMMAQEVEMLLRGLALWAKAYKLIWQIQLEGATVGFVDRAGNYSDDLRQFVSELHEAAGTPRDTEAVKSKVAELRAKYAGRR